MGRTSILHCFSHMKGVITLLILLLSDASCLFLRLDIFSQSSGTPGESVGVHWRRVAGKQGWAQLEYDTVAHASFTCMNGPSLVHSTAFLPLDDLVLPGMPDLMLTSIQLTPCSWWTACWHGPGHFPPRHSNKPRTIPWKEMLTLHLGMSIVNLPGLGKVSTWPPDLQDRLCALTKLWSKETMLRDFNLNKVRDFRWVFTQICSRLAA